MFLLFLQYILVIVSFIVFDVYKMIYPIFQQYPGSIRGIVATSVSDKRF